MSEAAIPNHVGYIIDGNRRWAKQHGLPAYEGHMAGYNTIEEIAIETFKAGVKFVTIYTFSTENWKRNQNEVKRIMGLVLKLLTTDLHILEENNIRLCVLGSRDNVNERILKAIDDAEVRTADNTAGTLALCFNYGGQLEIVDAVKKIVKSGIKPDKITTELISQNLYAPEIPPLDLVVRTSGEHRISNFMLWRIDYSELLFINKNLPDMTKDDVTTIIKEYAKRSRRIGK